MTELARQFVRNRLDASETMRPLGSFEHLFWLMDQNRPVHFAVTAQITGRTSPRDWRQALDNVQERHKLLSVRIEESPGSIPQYRQVDAAPIPLRIVEDDPETRWADEVGEELATPFDPHGAPLVRAILIQGIEDAAFILVAHHAIADGVSVAYVIRDTLRALAGGTLERLPLSPTQDAILGLDHVPVRRGADEHEQDAPAATASTYRPRDNARPSVDGLRLAPLLTARLRDRARLEGTTVHGALCAAFALAGRQVSADWRDIPVRIVSPINIRPTLGVSEDCGVFISAAPSVFEVGATGFWDLARHAKAGVAAGQARESVEAVISALQQAVGSGPDVAAASEFAATAFAREGMMTNLGPLPFPSRFGALRLKALWGPAVLQGLEGEQTIGVATVDGSLYLTHTSHTPPAGLLEAMESVLVEACSM
jgi:hypothetical protein